MKKRSSNEKAGIYVIIFMLALFVVVIILYVLGIIGKEADSADIIVDNSIMFRYVDDTWIEVEKNSYEEYNWNKYNIFADGEKLGRYSVYSYDKKFYVFNDNNGKRDPVNVVGDSVYLGGKIKTEFYNYKISQLNDEDIKYVTEVLDAYDVKESDQKKYTYRYKVSYDFDNDSKIEDLYVVSNLFSDQEVDDSYSFMFIREDNGKTKLIYNKVYGKNENLMGCYAYLFAIIKIDNSDVPQLVTKCTKYSVGNNSEYGLYQYNNNKYELLIYSK